MKKILFSVALSGLAASPAAWSSVPTVLTFDDVSTGTLIYDYGGLSGWEMLGAVNNWDWTGGTNVFQGHAGTLTFTDGPVRFQGMDYIGWNGDLSPGGIALYLHGTEVFRSDIPTPYDQVDLAWFASGYGGPIDQIEFYVPIGGDGYAFDNLTFTAAVPEPETYAMFLSGLALIAWAARYRRTDTA